MENFNYHYWILHKKLVRDKIFIISQKSTRISTNIGLRILIPHIPEHPFPLAGHIFFCLGFCGQIMYLGPNVSKIVPKIVIQLPQSLQSFYSGSKVVIMVKQL